MKKIAIIGALLAFCCLGVTISYSGSKSLSINDINIVDIQNAYAQSSPEQSDWIDSISDFFSDAWNTITSYDLKLTSNSSVSWSWSMTVSNGTDTTTVSGTGHINSSDTLTIDGNIPVW